MKEKKEGTRRGGKLAAETRHDGGVGVEGRNEMSNNFDDARE